MTTKKLGKLSTSDKSREKDKRIIQQELLCTCYNFTKRKFAHHMVPLDVKLVAISAGS